MKVCHIARDIRASGGGEVVKQVSLKMAKQGITVVVITDTASVDLGPGIRIVETPFGDRLLKWMPTSRTGWLLRHLAQIVVFTVMSSLIGGWFRFKGFLVFNHNCESLVGQVLVMHNVFSAEFSARSLSLPQRLKALANPVRLLRISKEILLSRPKFGKILISVSEGAKGDVEALAGGSQRVRVIENGVDIERFGQSADLEVPSVVTDWKRAADILHTILFIGHEWKRKGLDELIAAMTDLPSNFGLVVVGGTSQNRELYDHKIAQLGIGERVFFAGEWPDVRPFLAGADIFCLPSHAETMPLVALEALAAGVPIVLTPECPASALIVEGLNGAVTGCVPREIALAIERSVNVASEKASSVRIKGTVDRYDWDIVASGYIEVAADLIHSAPRSAFRDKGDELESGTNR
ncbi:putative glycosyltransferase [Paenarthrobacter nicotinovorans]|uniref:glycosyltransferase family 4 protein n=1 Tax=Paenarthrobacter nicotinovorans TaxID=29320 RepID=UPI0007CBC4A3|nr:glycosyltransferase family 4 protein [Paenarthrobacter nicotinovorans]GAT85540.1 putative glycosyltransferase [Paenarthrobacter nicotinovorans]